MTPRAVLPKCGSPLRASARIRYRILHPEPGLLRRNLHAVYELDSRPRIFREQEVPVEIDVVEQRGDLRTRGNSQARLDHAPEHRAEAERARGVHHPHRLPNAARLRE